MEQPIAGSVFDAIRRFVFLIPISLISLGLMACGSTLPASNTGAGLPYTLPTARPSGGSPSGSPSATVTLTPDLATWEADAGSYSNTTTGYGSTSTALGAGSISYPASTVVTVGQSWNTWCCSYLGQAIWTGGPSSIVVTLSGLSQFGVQIEPNPYTTDSITMTLSNGQSLTQAIGGESGAQFFGFVGAGITSLTITDNSGNDFAFGNFYSGAGTNSVTVTSADLVSNSVSVTLAGSATSHGVLTINALGSSNTYSVSASNGVPVGPGTYSVPLTRTAIPIDNYTSVQAVWDIGSPASNTLTLDDEWEVRGVIRHSQYNVPMENSCVGAAQTAYIVASDCTYTKISLASDFVMQTQENGTGSSLDYGLLKPMGSTITAIGKKCRRFLPVAVADSAFVKVTSITGSCNETLTPGTAVAVYPNPNASNTVPPASVCDDNQLLVTSAGANQAVKPTLDYCPACVGDFRGTSGHIDNFSTSNACSAHSALDLGNFWTADTQGQKQ